MRLSQGAIGVISVIEVIEMEYIGNMKSWAVIDDGVIIQCCLTEEKANHLAAELDIRKSDDKSNNDKF